MYKYKIVGLLYILFLSSCYYDGDTGCTQYFNYVDCPRPHLYKEGVTDVEKNIHINQCIKNHNTTEQIYRCMENKGYRRINTL